MKEIGYTSAIAGDDVFNYFLANLIFSAYNYGQNSNKGIDKKIEPARITVFPTNCETVFPTKLRFPPKSVDFSLQNAGRGIN